MAHDALTPGAAPALPAPAALRLPWFVRRDMDGFFGLFVDNLINLLAMAALWELLGLPVGLVYKYVLPGAAVSIAFGNVFYCWQARRLARREGRADVTALPYGINTPSLFAYLLVIIGPVFAIRHGQLTAQYAGEWGADRIALEAAAFAWMMGVLACFGSGVIELLGAFVGRWVKRVTPRAAMLSTLGAIAISLISFPFLLDLFHSPLVAFVPFALVFVGYFARVRMPLGLPAGLVAVLAGVALAWLLGPVLAGRVQPWLAAEFGVEVALPADLSPLPADASARVAATWEDLTHRWAGDEIEVSAAGAQRPALRWFPPLLIVGHAQGWIERFRAGAPGYEWSTLLSYLTLVGVMGFMNALGTLQNLESAEAAGDRFPLRSTMAVNGLGSMLGAALGSCFPTTVYIGHPGWKALGARQGYSLLNAAVLLVLCCSGLMLALRFIIPKEVGSPILLWIGVIILAQAFQATPRRHAPAVAVGLFPALAYWALLLINGTVKAHLPFPGLDQSTAAGADAARAYFALPTVAGLTRLEDLLIVGGGFLLSAMILAALVVAIIDRRFRAGAGWAAAGAAATFCGFIHTGAFRSGELVDDVGLRGEFPFTDRPALTAGYLAFALVLLYFDSRQRGEPSTGGRSEPEASATAPHEPGDEPP